MRLFIAITCLVSLALFACDPEDTGNPNTPGPTAEVTQPTDIAPTSTALLTIATAETNTDFGRDPISEPALATTNATLTRAEAGTPDTEPGTPAYDRITFVFGGDLPAYEINYVPGPVLACGSGEDAQVTGQAFLQISLSPAVAHDDQGTQTITSTDLLLGLPVLQQAKQTCDFEGVVVWTLGLSAEVDFRVNAIIDQFLVVDLKHP